MLFILIDVHAVRVKFADPVRKHFRNTGLFTDMSLAGVYVIPHGDELVDNPSEGSKILRKHIEQISKSDNSDTIAIISPHGLRLRGKVSVINTEWLRSSYNTEGKNFVNARYRTDRTLASLLTDGLERFTEEVQFVTSSGDLSEFPVDFGTAIPLSFFSEKKIVSMGQPRIFDRKFLVDFGKALYRTVNEYNARVSIILSADQAHTHWSGGPYGYSDSAVDYDRKIVEALNSSDFSRMLEMSEEYIDAAKPDSYWNMLILSGILESAGIKLHVLDYYVEKYFGMLVAAPTE